MNYNMGLVDISGICAPKYVTTVLWDLLALYLSNNY